MKHSIAIKGFPRNKDKFIRLIEFFKEVLDICYSLNITPIVDGGLAVFVYTKNRDMVINDIDVGFPETEYPRMIKALDEKRISHKLREWHVLQVVRENLRIELGSVEYWYKDLPVECETLQIDNYKVKMLNLVCLKELYQRGIKYFANSELEADKPRFETYKAKYEMLEKIEE